MDVCGFCLFFAVRFSSECKITSWTPSLQSAHPIRSSQHCKSSRFQSYSGCFPTRYLQCLVFRWLRFCLSTVFLHSTQSLIENLSFDLCTQRSEVRYGSRTASLELQYILKPTQGHFSVPDTHWHDSLNKVERYFQVWKDTPVENDVSCLSKLRFDYFESIICIIQHWVSKSSH